MALVIHSASRIPHYPKHPRTTCLLNSVPKIEETSQQKPGRKPKNIAKCLNVRHFRSHKTTGFDIILIRNGFMSYSLGFTAASLRPELLRAIIEIQAQEPSWEHTKNRILGENVLQSRSPNSAARMERELRPRIQTFTDSQIAMFRISTRDVQTQLAWLAAVKHNAMLLDFAAVVLRAKIEIHDPVLRASDWEGFLEDQKSSHPEIASFSAMTLGKVKRVVFAMLREVGILIAGDAVGLIQRPVLNPELEKVIRLDDPKWLSAFLVPDTEIRESRHSLP